MFSHTTGLSALFYTSHGPPDTLNQSISPDHAQLTAAVPVDPGDWFSINVTRSPGYCNPTPEVLLLRLESDKKRGPTLVVACSDSSNNSWTLSGTISSQSLVPRLT